MTGGPRRRVDDHHPTIGEVARRLDRHEQQTDAIHDRFLEMIDKLDERTDALVVRVAIVFAIATLLWGVIVLLAPFLRAFLGIPGG